MSKKVMVISVHPDDETLGAGGAILKHQKAGDQVYCLYITKGNDEQALIMEKVNFIYNFTETFCLDLRDLYLDDLSLNDIIPLISKIFNQIKPEIIFIPNRSDVHSDHRKIYSALLACTKSFRYPYIKKVLMMEVQSETDFAPPLPENAFLPNVFYDITDVYDKKMSVMKLYESELLPDGFTRSLRSIEAQNQYRGSQINALYAEAFMLIKEIN
jgi:LmbE family N-acetylglucosaminyl deacetylase